MRRFLASGAALLALGVTTSGEVRAWDDGKALSQLGIDSWQVEQGLPQNSVWAIAQTPDGYLWFATSEGLARFDGLRFRVYDKRSSPIPSSTVRSLNVASDGTLWLGTEEGGLLRRDGNGSFVRVALPEDLAAASIRAVRTTRDGSVWVGSGGQGILVIRPDGGQTRLTRAQGLPDDDVTSLAEAPDGSIWVSTGRGVCRVGPEGCRAPARAPEAKVNAVAVRGDELWIGTEAEGVFRLRVDDVSAPAVRVGLPNATVRAFHFGSGGATWIGTYGGGVHRLAGGRLESLRRADGLPSDSVTSLLAARNGDVWIGTNGGGVARLRNGLFATYTPREGLPIDMVRSVLETSDGSVLVGTEGGGLTRIARGPGGVETLTRVDGLSDERVYALAEDREGRVWLGGFGGGLDLLDGRKARPAHASGPLPGIHTLVASPDGSLWVGTLRDGVLRYVPGDVSRPGPVNGRVVLRLSSRDGLSSDRVLSLLEEPEGRLVVGLAGGSVSFVAQGRVVETVRLPPSEGAFSLVRNEDGSIWAGTGGAGLCRVTPGPVACLGVSNGLVDDVIYGMVDDGRGALWLTSNRGICRVPRSDLEAAFAKPSRRVQPILFGTADGLRSAECNSGGVPAFRARDGRLWFPTTRGVAVVDPVAASRAGRAPATLLEEVVVDGRAETVRTFPPGTERLEIHFSAPTASAPERTRFRYRLRPLDGDWVEWGTRRVAYFNHLRPGPYVFEVAAWDDAGRASGEPATLAFRLEPRFGETRAFFVLVSALVVGAVAGAWRYRTRALKARETRLVALVHDRTQDVEVALRKEAEARKEAESQRERAEDASRAKSSFLANTSHELRTPLNAILGYSELLLEDEEVQRRRQDLQKIHASGKHLLGLINDILDLSKIEAGKMDILLEDFDVRSLVEELVQTVEPLVDRQSNRLVVDAPPDLGTMRSDSTKVRQILFNLLANATKFTKDGTIRLTVSRNGAPGDEAFLFEVSDSGIGMSPEQLQRLFRPFEQAEATTSRRFGGTGLGLTISRRFAEMMGGSIDAQSEEGRGSRFTVRLPVVTHAPG